MSGKKAPETLENKRFDLVGLLLEYNSYVILVALIIASAILSPYFFTKNNLCNLARQYSMYFLLTVGILFIIFTGSIDLSLGSTIGFGGIMYGVALENWGMNQMGVGGYLLSLLIALCAGALVGAFNGVLVAKLNMMPFVATLAVQIAFRGLTYIICAQIPIRLTTGTVAVDLGMSIAANSDPILKLPYLFWIVLVVILVFAWILKYTVYGRMCMATGSNAEAVRFAGINVAFYKFMPYVIGGVFAAAAGGILACRAGVATPQAGDGYECDAIAAGVIGGASLDGGKGSVLRGVVGMCIIALITNIMNLLAVASYPQKVVKGLIIIVAVLLLDFTNRRKAMKLR